MHAFIYLNAGLTIRPVKVLLPPAAAESRDKVVKWYVRHRKIKALWNQIHQTRIIWVQMTHCANKCITVLSSCLSAIWQRLYYLLTDLKLSLWSSPAQRRHSAAHTPYVPVRIPYASSVISRIFTAALRVCSCLPTSDFPSRQPDMVKSWDSIWDNAAWKLKLCRGLRTVVEPLY